MFELGCSTMTGYCKQAAASNEEGRFRMVVWAVSKCQITFELQEKVSSTYTTSRRYLLALASWLLAFPMSLNATCVLSSAHCNKPVARLKGMRGKTVLAHQATNSWKGPLRRRSGEEHAKRMYGLWGSVLVSWCCCCGQD